MTLSCFLDGDNPWMPNLNIANINASEIQQKEIFLKHFEILKVPVMFSCRKHSGHQLAVLGPF